MFNRHTLKNLVVVLMLSVTVAGLSACSKDQIDLTGADNPGAGAPALPPMSTMTMDLSFFGIDGTSLDQARSMNGDMMLANAGNRTHFINAIVRVLYIQLTLFDVLEEPVGAFAAAIHSVPQPQDDGSYLWTFIFVDNGNEYSIFLYGKEDVDHINWRLEVSTNIPEFQLNHFVWFDGQSREHDGYWQFYNPILGGQAPAAMGAPTEGIPSARMDWENAGNDEHLTIVVNEPGGVDEGDRLAFYGSPDMGTIDYHDEDLQIDDNITWYADGTGSITVHDYNNGETGCWDEMQKDVDCQ